LYFYTTSVTKGVAYYSSNISSSWC